MLRVEHSREAARLTLSAASDRQRDLQSFVVELLLVTESNFAVTEFIRHRSLICRRRGVPARSCSSPKDLFARP